MIQIGSLTIPIDGTAVLLHCRKTERGLEVVTDDGKRFDAATFRHLKTSEEPRLARPTLLLFFPLPSV